MRKLIVTTSFLAACGTTTQWVPTNPSPRPMTPRSASSVEVWTTGVPNKPYTEVGLITARQSSGYSTHGMPDIINALRVEAGRIGCDAVMLKGKDDTVVGGGSSFRGTGSSSTTTLEGFWGACLMYLDDEVIPMPDRYGE